MKKINLVEILKNAPEGTKLWSPIFGVVTFEEIMKGRINYPIIVLACGERLSFNQFGLYYITYHDAECTLFPSKENRDWE